MAERVAHNRRRLLLVAAGWVAVAVMGTPSHAQTPTAASPTFDVVTIKPGRHVTKNGFMSSPGRFTAMDATLKNLIQDAYGLRNSPYGIDGQITGGPGWVNSATFDVEAKAEEPVPAKWEKIPGGQRNELMLQALLADRFKLKVHHETKELLVYALTVAKNGPKLTPSVAPATPAAESAPTYAFGARLPTPQADHWRGIRAVGARPMYGGSIAARRETTSMFTEFFLQDQPEIGGRMVIDRTGLTGEYDFTLQWTPEQMPNGAPPPDPSWPSLFTALQEQLGLKLESTNGPVDTIVIDSVEMPSEN
jgi:uncharacterized protein (TIGR03435 family)